MKLRKAICVAAILALCGCGKQRQVAAVPDAAASAPAASDSEQHRPDLSKYAELMQAVFGKDYRRDSGSAEVDLPDPEERNQTSKFLLTPVAMQVLADGTSVLVLNGEALDDNGTTMSAHGTPGLLSVYLLRKEAGQWKVWRRHENIDGLGSNGSIGSVKWTMLADGKPGLAIEHGGTWQGHTITLLSLYDVTAENVSDLVGAIKIHSDNTGWCGPATEKCWEVSGHWQFVRSNTGAAYDDLRVDFTGQEKIALAAVTDTETDVEPARKTVPITGSARYVFKDGGYQLANGENIVPDV
ncbi:hypothetical protein GCM10027277_53550 [Pseudoduganella ginsengisoli]|uniref:Lipoprotein n=1 Tax=Pseudoduganella ginsengisoli TaxID=1462440 RepID=A0A6L6Q1N5_9BURK|nr:hypothetical protein [Pseudoduganella ginsengisoli]MTW03349.1 hypothetical protein [Pseudoduganella ginsengisoli]